LSKNVKKGGEKEMGDRQKMKVSLEWWETDVLRKALEDLRKHRGIQEGKCLNFDDMYSVSWSSDGVVIATFENQKTI